ncbi:hypothetical protein [Streptomyces sp. NPDC049744]|uniref:hypothetical protein n=1 Tax=Streptomyces sp. NPDC049744 TaxID=3154359 RepID=UPI003426F713
MISTGSGCHTGTHSASANSFIASAQTPQEVPEEMAEVVLPFLAAHQQWAPSRRGRNITSGRTSHRL